VQVLLPCHLGRLLHIHLLRTPAEEPGQQRAHAADMGLATLPLLVLPEAACEEASSSPADCMLATC
jgi:hypothetical protein